MIGKYSVYLKHLLMIMKLITAASREKNTTKKKKQKKTKNIHLLELEEETEFCLLRADLNGKGSKVK